MLRSAKRMKGFEVVGSDGQVGRVEDLYFDDARWTMRYLVVDTGGWLTGRHVLITPHSVQELRWDDKAVRLSLTRRQIEDSPGTEMHKPIARQHEEDLYRHYGYPEYWSGPYLWGYTLLPNLLEQKPMETPQRREFREQVEAASYDSHLRSSKEVIGYHIRANDGTLGHVEDFLFDDRDWSIQLMLVDTRNWWPGKHVLVSPRRIDSVDWNGKLVHMKVSRAEIENSPEYDTLRPPSEEAPQDLYGPQQLPPDWS